MPATSTFSRHSTVPSCPQVFGLVGQVVLARRSQNWHSPLFCECLTGTGHCGAHTQMVLFDRRCLGLSRCLPRELRTWCWTCAPSIGTAVICAHWPTQTASEFWTSTSGPVWRPTAWRLPTHHCCLLYSCTPLLKMLTCSFRLTGKKVQGQPFELIVEGSVFIRI